MMSAYCAPHRPGIIFTQAKIDTLKHRIKSDGQIRQAYNAIKQRADNSIGKHRPLNSLEDLALVYLVSGDSKYADKIVETLSDVDEIESFEPVDMLHREPAWIASLPTAKACYQMAVGYDAVYPMLSDEDKVRLSEIIYAKGIAPIVHDWLDPATRHHAINTMGHNYWMACIGNCAIGCMALAAEKPELTDIVDNAVKAVRDWYEFEGDMMQNKPRNIDDGAYYESVNYANYGLSQFLMFHYALGNFRDGDYQLPDDCGNIASYFINVSYPSSTEPMKSLYFGDSNDHANGEACVKLLYEMGCRDDNMLWYLVNVPTGLHKEGLPLDSPLGLLITPKLDDAPGQPSLALNKVYHANGWATLRDTWEADGTFLGIKCGHTWNHAHADAGSFILFHNGIQVVKDGGNCWYANKNYRNYFFQNEAHNVVLTDKKAQSSTQQYLGSPLDGELSDCVADKGIKFITANATGPTSQYFSRNLRSFLWIDDVILVVDDVRSHDYGRFSMLFHPDGESRKNGIDIDVDNKGSRIKIRPLVPEYLTESDFEHDFPDNLKVESISAPKAKDLDVNETYYSVTDPHMKNSEKYVTAIILESDGKPTPTVRRIDAIDGYGIVIESGDCITEVYLNQRADGHIMHRNSCNVFGGYDTDAYILAYTYRRDMPDDVCRMFVGYGSYVRGSDRKVIFDSYTKTNIIL